MSSCKGSFNEIEIYGLSALNIVMVIVFTAVIHRATKIPQWVLVVPVAFVLFKLLCLDTIFFNAEKTGIVSGVSSRLF